MGNWIKRAAVMNTTLFECWRSEAGYFFELSREMRDAAVIELKRDLAEAHFIIDQQFFGLFDFLADDKLFDRYPFRFWKQFA